MAFDPAEREAELRQFHLEGGALREGAPPITRSTPARPTDSALRTVGAGMLEHAVLMDAALMCVKALAPTIAVWLHDEAGDRRRGDRCVMYSA